MAKKKQHGGKRKSAGRKPIDDKKVPVTIYVKEKCYESLFLLKSGKLFSTDSFMYIVSII